jgi:hypothetical protein
MDYSIMADQYVVINEEYNALKARLEKVGRERRELAEKLVELMDADAVGSLYGTDGQKISTVHRTYATVTDLGVFRRYVESEGVRDEFLKEVVVKKAINEVAKVAVNNAKNLGCPPQKIMPPGLGINFSTSLRVTKPSNDEAGFKSAAQGLVEMIEEERKHESTKS